MKAKYLLPVYGGWVGLGFYRGTNMYRHDVKSEKFMYSDSIGWGLFGMFMYANPAFFPVGMRKEAYRLEVNARNLEIEKKYHDLF